MPAKAWAKVESVVAEPFYKPDNRFLLASGTMEAVKWLAVILMAMDHVNRLLLNWSHPFMFYAGRSAMPLFVFILAYNLAQPQARENGAARRVLERLLPIAVISSLPYLELNMETLGFFPLNILFTLAIGTVLVMLLEHPTWPQLILAAVLFAATGKFVDYGWSGIGLFVSVWYFFRGPSLWRGAIVLLVLILMGVVANGNQWALVAVPILGLSFYLRLPVKRIKYALYYFYPVHLMVIAVLKITVF